MQAARAPAHTKRSAARGRFAFGLPMICWFFPSARACTNSAARKGGAGGNLWPPAPSARVTFARWHRIIRIDLLRASAECQQHTERHHYRPANPVQLTPGAGGPHYAYDARSCVGVCNDRHHLECQIDARKNCKALPIGIVFDELRKESSEYQHRFWVAGGDDELF